MARYDQELGALAGLSSTNVGKLVHEQLALQMVILKEVSCEDDDDVDVCPQGFCAILFSISILIKYGKWTK